MWRRIYEINIKYRHHKSAECHPSLANAELMSDSPVLEGFAFAEGWRRLVESDTVRTTDTLQQESGKDQLVDGSPLEDKNLYDASIF